MPSATGQSWEKYQKKFADDEPEEKKITPLSDEDIQVLKTYGAAPYAAALKKLEKEIKDRQTSVNEKIGVKVSSLSLLYTHIRIHTHALAGVRHRSRPSASLGYCRR
jgi:26S proteasome regulatory subunit T1